MEPENTENTLLEFFKALAEPRRLKIIGVLAQRPSTVEELAAMLELSESTVSHHLSLLARAGLVSARAQGYYNVYQFESEALQNMAEELLKDDTLPAMAEDVNLDAFDQSVVKNFLDRDGKLKALPSQEKKFQAILRYAVQLFEIDHSYTEKEVNQILSELYADTASLRRGMIDFQLMQREAGIYTRL